jgi:hypothetical protein
MTLVLPKEQPSTVFNFKYFLVDRSIDNYQCEKIYNDAISSIPDLAKICDVEAFLRSYTIVRAYSLPVEIRGLTKIALIPILSKVTYFIFIGTIRMQLNNTNIAIVYSSQSKSIKVKSLRVLTKGEEIILPTKKARSNEDYLKLYATTFPELESAALVLDVSLNGRDPMLSIKRTLFSLAYFKNLNTEYGFGIRVDTPENELELQTIISPYRIIAYTTYKPFLEGVI